MEKKDFDQIKTIVKAVVSDESSSLKQQIFALDKKVDKNHDEIIDRLSRLQKMESEDIGVIADDVEDLKIRVTKLETR